MRYIRNLYDLEATLDAIVLDRRDIFVEDK